MTRIANRNPPQPIGEITLLTYDGELWQRAAEGASEWQIDLGLYVHYALRAYVKRGEDRKRFVKWKEAQDLRDPDLKTIHDFLHDNAPRTPHTPRARRRGA